MNTNNQNESSEFSDKKEALEFLLEEKADRERKANWAQTMPGNPNKQSKLSRRKGGIIAFSVVVAILLLLFMVIFNNKSIDQDPVLMASNMLQQTTFEGPTTTRGISNENPPANHDQLIAALSEKKYEEAIRIFEATNGTLTLQDKFYYAVTLVNTDSQQKVKIIDLTNDVLASKNQYNAEALWIRGITHLKLGNQEDAKKDFTRLLKLSYKTQEVEQLLNSETFK